MNRTHILRYLKSTPGFGAALVFTLIGGVYLGHSGGEAFLLAQLRALGVETTAEVIALERGASVSESPRLKLRVTDREGREHIVRRRVRSSSYRAGERVDVVHMPGSVRRLALRSELTNTRLARDLFWLMGVGAVMFLPGVWIGARNLHRALVVDRLLREGRARRGRIVSVDPRPYKLGGWQPTSLVVEYRDPEGVRRQRRTDTVPRERESIYEAEQEVEILVHPEMPAQMLVDVWGWREDAETAQEVGAEA